MPKLSFSLPYDAAVMTASAPGMGRGMEGTRSSVVWLLHSPLSGDQPDKGDLGGRAPMSLRLQQGDRASFSHSQQGHQ